MHKHADGFTGSAGSPPSIESNSAATGTSRVVLKLGSRLLTGGTALLDPRRMAAIAEAVAAAPDTQVVLVSSGAVAAGFASLGHRTPPTRLSDRQAAAAVGQGRLMHRWAEAFAAVGRDVGQVLLTNDCLTDRRRYNAARQALAALMQESDRMKGRETAVIVTGGNIDTDWFVTVMQGSLPVV